VQGALRVPQLIPSETRRALNGSSSIRVGGLSLTAVDEELARNRDHSAKQHAKKRSNASSAVIRCGYHQLHTAAHGASLLGTDWLPNGHSGSAGCE
jgi:hypothetical protein